MDSPPKHAGDEETTETDRYSAPSFNPAVVGADSLKFGPDFVGSEEMAPPQPEPTAPPPLEGPPPVRAAGAGRGLGHGAALEGSSRQVARRAHPKIKDDEESYVGLLVRTSLMLASDDFPPEVQCMGDRMTEHLLKFRREELSSADWFNLTVGLQNQTSSESANSRLQTDEVDDRPVVEVGPKDQYCFDTRIIVSEILIDMVHPEMLGFDGKADTHQVKGCLLLADHNILCEAFYITSSFWNTQCQNVLLHLCKSLNTIWTQPEWESTFLCNGFGISCLLSDGCFLKKVYNVVNFCEFKLKHTEDVTNDICSLIHMVLPFLLQLLRCIHSLWEEKIACNLSEELKSAKLLSNNDEDQQNEVRKLLEQIRESGYNIIGLSMRLEEAFTNTLDHISLSLAFVNFGSMEFRHLGKLIKLIILPLVNNCPPKHWKEWMLNFLGPFIRHCEDILHYAWLSFLHEGRARVSYYFGKLYGSTKDIEEMEHNILLQFTRDISYLLGHLSSLESNSRSQRYKVANIKGRTYVQTLESPSLIRYLFDHNCFGRLRMSLFGYWVDNEAAKEALHFCRSLVQFAGVHTDERLRLFVSDELLPSVIKRLHDQLPCAIRHLIIPNHHVNEDLIALCYDSYNYLSSKSSVQGQDPTLESIKDFACWLAKLKEDLCMKASRAAPEEFKEEKVEWNWEFQDEFERYLPVYIDLLKEMDAMEDTTEHDYVDSEVLLQKLRPEFRLKYGIHSREHPYWMAISNMRRRKFYLTTQVQKRRNMCEIIRKLITHTPYIKMSDCPHMLMDHLQQTPQSPFSTFPFYDVENSIDFLFDSVLNFWEPCFHPLIREEHKNLLVQIAEQLINAKEFESFQSLAPDPEDFPSHLVPYALSYIVMKLETSKAIRQARMHNEYDKHLSSNLLDDLSKKLLDNNFDRSMSTKTGCYEKDLTSWAMLSQFSDLDHDLIELSLKRKTQIAQINHETKQYLCWLKVLLDDQSHKDELRDLMKELEVKGFFDIGNSHIKLENEFFTELIDKFSNKVFRDDAVSRPYVIRGIIDYRTISLSMDEAQGSFDKVVRDTRGKLMEYLPQFWKDSRYYKHDLYDIVQQPLGKIFV